MAGQREGKSQGLYQRAAAALGLAAAWPIIRNLVGNLVGPLLCTVIVGLILGTVFGGRAAWADGEGAGSVGAVERGEPAAAVPLRVDQAVEVPLALPLRLPHLGPRYAMVTLDLFIAVGQKGSDINLGLALRRLREDVDVRLIFHPVTGGAVAERGAEAIWEACEQQPARCYGFISRLYSHPEWLALTSDAEEALYGAAAESGLDAPRLRRALYSRRHRAAVNELWLAAREQVRYPPELWVNGHHLRGTLTDAQLHEELDTQRSRAQRALQTGTPVTQLYERLVADENRPEDNSSPARAWGRVNLLPMTPTAVAPTHLDLTGVPSRGPRVAPVTVTLIGSLDTYGTYGAARAASEVWSRHSDSVRLVYLHAPRSPTSQRIAVLMAQVALVDVPRFWRLFDNMLEQLPKSFFLRYPAVESLIQREAGYSMIEAGLRTPFAELQIKHDLEQARRLGIEYTPIVLVNGVPVRGLPLTEALEVAIERERQRGLLQRLHSPPLRTDASWLVR